MHPTEVPGGAAGAAVGSWCGARRPRGLLSRPIPGELCSPLPENPNAKARSIVEKVCCSVLNRAHLDQNVLEICDAYTLSNYIRYLGMIHCTQIPLRIDNRRQSVIRAALHSFLDIVCAVLFYVSNERLNFPLTSRLSIIISIFVFQMISI